MPARRKKSEPKPKFTAEEMVRLRKNYATWLVSTAKLLAGHIQNGTIDGVTMNANARKDTNSLNLFGDNTNDSWEFLPDGGVRLRKPEPPFEDGGSADSAFNAVQARTASMLKVVLAPLGWRYDYATGVSEDEAIRMLTEAIAKHKQDAVTAEIEGMRKVLKEALPYVRAQRARRPAP